MKKKLLKVVCEEATRQTAYQMGLTGWLEIMVRFDEDGMDDEETVPAPAKSRNNWEYRTTTIIWNLGECAQMTKTEIRNIAIHELTHSLIEPLWDSHPDKKKTHVTKVGELSVENVARVVRHLLEEK